MDYKNNKLNYLTEIKDIQNNVSSMNLSFLLYYKPPLPLLWKRRGREVMEEEVKC